MATALAVLFWRYSPDGEFFAGLMFGSVLGMIMWVRDDPPESIARLKRGADGERKTGAVLDRLGNLGWYSVHDRAGAGKSNLDHIVVGPGGVFLLDSKNLSGTVTVDEHGLRTQHRGPLKNGFRDARLAAHMRGSARFLKERIAETTELRKWVQSVVVIWGEFPQGEVHQDLVTYVSGDRLEAWLIAQPAKLTPRDRRFIELGLKAEIVVPRARPILENAR